MSRFQFYTAREIAESTPSTPEWIVYPWIARGAITEVDGKIKAAGKTTWLQAMCRAALDGTAFMGKPTMQTPIVYLTEQSPRSLRESLRRAHLLDRDDFHVLYWHDTSGASWPDIAREAADYAVEVGALLLVVDTLGQFAGLKGDEENQSGAAQEAVKPLQMVTGGSKNMPGVVFVRHDRKSGGVVGDSGRGSSAFGGAVDIILSVRRPEGNYAKTVRQITSLSRYDETPEELFIDLTDAGYMWLGDKAAMAVPEAVKLLLELAPTSEQDAMTIEWLIAATIDGDTPRVSRTTMQKAITETLADERLRKLGNGVKNSPVRYWRPADYSAPSKVERQAETNADPIGFILPDIQSVMGQKAN